MEEASKPIIKIYGTRGSAACYSIRDYLHRSDVTFQWIDLGSDQQARCEAQVSGLEDQRLPICECPRRDTHGARNVSSSPRQTRLV